MSVFFTSDTHFGHNNIIRYCDRPFADADEMDEALVANWNAAVKPTDTVWHLGDVALCSVSRLREILDCLNGNIHLVIGNHERATLQLRDRFVEVVDRKILRAVLVDGEAGLSKDIVLDH